MDIFLLYIKEKPDFIRNFNKISISFVLIKLVYRFMEQPCCATSLNGSLRLKLHFKKVYISLLTFAFTKHHNIWLFFSKLARHQVTSSNSTFGIAPNFPAKYAFLMLSLVLVEKKLILYNSETPSAFSLSAK